MKSILFVLAFVAMCAPAFAQDQIKVKDREPALLGTSSGLEQAKTKLMSFFDEKGLIAHYDAAEQTITTEWGLHRHCGFGIQWCENKVHLMLSSQGDKTQLKLRVMQRKRNGGLDSNQQWKENGDSNGTDTSKMANEIQNFLNGNVDASH